MWYKLITMIEDCKQIGQKPVDEAINQPKAQVESFYMQNYQNLMGSASADNDIELILSQHKILYTPKSSFQEFSFQVEWIIPAPDFYKVNVKIAQFSLSMTVLRHYSLNPFKEHYKSEGSFGTIYFVEFNNMSLCFKSFQFSKEEEFQPLFQRVVKELSILKICSALECAPYLENYIGFDLVFYDNCIQFATQQGKNIAYLTHRDKENLKQQLALLHKLKIIHYDIKPENIVFSETFQKPVFIDFGMSQVIEEQLGYKTLAGFRGTPNYCTPEILDLMMEQQGWADLYYNDSFCLSVSADEMEKQSLENCQQEDSLIKTKRINKHQSLHLFVFYFYYLHSKEFQCKVSLQKYFYFGGNVRKVLQFIKQVLRYVFIASIFDQFLIQYKGHILYQEIAEQRKISDQRIFFRRSSDDNDIARDDRLFSPLSYHPGSQNEDSFDRLDIGRSKKDYINLYEVIMKIAILEERTIWNYFSIVLSCLRFDTRNLSIQQKYKIAKKITPLIVSFRGKEAISGEEQQGRVEIKQIKLLFKSILQLFLEIRPERWNKGNLFDIFEQLAVLDADLSPYIDSFLHYFEFNASSPLQSILAVLQCNRIKNTMLLIYSDHMEKVDFVQSRIDLYIERNLLKFKQQTLKTTDKEIISILRIIQILQYNTQNCYQIMIADQEELLDCINNVKIRKCLLYIITSDYRLEQIV